MQLIRVGNENSEFRYLFNYWL